MKIREVKRQYRTRWKKSMWKRSRLEMASCLFFVCCAVFVLAVSVRMTDTRHRIPVESKEQPWVSALAFYLGKTSLCCSGAACPGLADPWASHDSLVSVSHFPGGALEILNSAFCDLRRSKPKPCANITSALHTEESQQPENCMFYKHWFILSFSLSLPQCTGSSQIPQTSLKVMVLLL